MPMLWRVLICAGRPAPPPPASRRRYKRDHGTAPIARASPWDFPRTARWAASPTPGTSPPLSRLAEWTVDAYCHNETYGKSRWRSAMAGAVGRRRSSWRKDGRVEEPPQRLAPRGRPAPWRVSIGFTHAFWPRLHPKHLVCKGSPRPEGRVHGAVLTRVCRKSLRYTAPPKGEDIPPTAPIKGCDHLA